MANFGFACLTVVAPYAEHWREARSAIGTQDLLRNANEAESLAEAVAECTLVIGTGTLAARKPAQQVVALPALAPLVRKELESGGKVALIFGPEKRGLTREDLSRCHLLVEIPTEVRQPSMNLGQAVAVCLYELSTRVFPMLESPTKAGLQSAGANAPSAMLDLVAEVIEQTMTAAEYSPEAMRAANRHDVRLLLHRLTLNPADAQRALGFFRRILYKLQDLRPKGGLTQ